MILIMAQTFDPQLSSYSMAQPLIDPYLQSCFLSSYPNPIFIAFSESKGRILLGNIWEVVQSERKSADRSDLTSVTLLTLMELMKEERIREAGSLPRGGN